MKTRLFMISAILINVILFNSCKKDSTDTTGGTGSIPQIPASGILYVGDNFIYVMDVSGLNPKKLSVSKEYFMENYPSSSYDGKKIVFTRYSKGIVVQDNSGEKIILGNTDGPVYTTWSKNSKIYYTRWNGLVSNGKEYVYSINPDGTGDTQVSPVYNSAATPGDDSPSLSPDNAYLLFSTNRTGNGGTILKLNLSDASNSYLTYSGNTLGQSVICPAEYPTWSPDGTKIAFSAYPGYPDFNRKEQIYVMSSDGSVKTALTNETAANCTYPSWSPDGTKIVFQKIFPGFSNNNEIWIMNADGSSAKALTDRTKTGYEQHPCFIGKPR